MITKTANERHYAKVPTNITPNSFVKMWDGWEYHPVLKDEVYKCIWLYLIKTVCFQDGAYAFERGIRFDLKRGEGFYTYSELMGEVAKNARKITTSQVRTILKVLEANNMIERKQTNRGSIIFITNYSKYQDKNTKNCKIYYVNFQKRKVQEEPLLNNDINQNRRHIAGTSQALYNNIKDIKDIKDLKKESIKEKNTHTSFKNLDESLEPFYQAYLKKANELEYLTDIQKNNLTKRMKVNTKQQFIDFLEKHKDRISTINSLLEELVEAHYKTESEIKPLAWFQKKLQEKLEGVLERQKIEDLAKKLQQERELNLERENKLDFDKFKKTLHTNLLETEGYKEKIELFKSLKIKYYDDSRRIFVINTNSTEFYYFIYHLFHNRFDRAIKKSFSNVMGFKLRGWELRLE